MSLFVAVSLGLTAQQKEITVESGTYGYSVSTQPSVIVTIPDGDKKVVEKLLAKEIKSWGGKMSNSGGEYTTKQSVSKKFFDGKTYDTYTRIYQDVKDLKIATAVDLGGAYMTETDHPLQFNEFKERMYKFALSAAATMKASLVKDEQKKLSGLEKELKSFDKEKASYQKQIDGYEKKINENKSKIEDVEKKITSKKDDITKQENLIKDLKNTTVK